MKWDAELYSRQNGYRTQVGIRLMERAGIGTHESVLDVGCGTGVLTAEIARTATRVVGIDPSGEMLAEACTQIRDMPNLSFVTGRAEEMDFSNEFHVVYSSNALQWVLPQERALNNIYAALVPGGRFVAQLPAHKFSTALTDSIWDAIQTIGLPQFGDHWESPWYLPTSQEYSDLLRRVGFLEVQTHVENFQVTYMSSTDALNWARSAALVPFLARMTTDEAHRFMYAVAMNFEKYRGNSPKASSESQNAQASREPIIFDFNRVVAFAHKGRNAPG